MGGSARTSHACQPNLAAIKCHMKEPKDSALDLRDPTSTGIKRG